VTKLRVLAEIGAPEAADGRPWGLRRTDLGALAGVREKLEERKVILVMPLAESGGGIASEVAAGAGPRAGGWATADGRAAAGERPRAGGSAPAEERSATAGSDSGERSATAVAVPETARAALSVAIGLAGAAVAAGTRTALIECDVEAPRLAAALGLEAVPGLHEYLRWEAAPADVVQSLVPTGAAAEGEEIPPLACVCAGRPSDSSRTLLGLGSFRHMTARLREAYELTILLGPPLEGAGGALDMVAAEADGSIAALPERPPRRAAGAIGEALAWLKTPPLGAIVATTSR
jgi:Mrp family chromosome partitioning ATPase